MPVPRFTLYVKPGCGWCDDAVEWLDSRGYAYDEIDVFSDPAAFAEMRRLSNQTRCPTLIAGEDILPDFDAGQLERFLKERGWLAAT